MFPLSEGMKIKACYQIFKKEALTGSQFLGGGEGLLRKRE